MRKNMRPLVEGWLYPRVPHLPTTDETLLIEHPILKANWPWQNDKPHPSLPHTRVWILGADKTLTQVQLPPEMRKPPIIMGSDLVPAGLEYDTIFMAVAWSVRSLNDTGMVRDTSGYIANHWPPKKLSDKGPVDGE